jgi:hypothetical protein
MKSPRLKEYRTAIRSTPCLWKVFYSYEEYSSSVSQVNDIIFDKRGFAHIDTASKNVTHFRSVAQVLKFNSLQIKQF